tara:strand:+ start:394 stop:627 length:234 start_codon:yes stop_codon:yes gene_type:complete
MSYVSLQVHAEESLSEASENKASCFSIKSRADKQRTKTRNTVAPELVAEDKGAAEHKNFAQSYKSSQSYATQIVCCK